MEKRKFHLNFWLEKMEIVTNVGTFTVDAAAQLQAEVHDGAKSGGKNNDGT
jgi:hypothetical protein